MGGYDEEKWNRQQELQGAHERWLDDVEKHGFPIPERRETATQGARALPPVQKAEGERVPALPQVPGDGSAEKKEGEK